MAILFYISPSDFDEDFANTIQTKKMSKYFSDHIPTYTIAHGTKDKQIQFLYLIRPLFSHFVKSLTFSIFALGIVLRLSNINEDQKKYIYTRSVYTALLFVLFGFRNVMLEVHDIRKNSISYFAHLWLASYKIAYVAISSPLRSCLISLKAKYISIKVFPDAHDNPVLSIQEGIDNYRDIRQRFNNVNKLSIGYFGKIAPHKGQELLTNIINDYSSSFDFHIYSKDHLKLKNLNCFTCEVPHDRVFESITKMDILLMTGVSSSSNFSHGNFTSPLKLYEYLSSLKPILYFPVGDLESELKGTLSAPFVYSSGFLSALSELLNAEDYVNLIQQTANLAHKRTWKNRCELIVRELNNVF